MFTEEIVGAGNDNTPSVVDALPETTANPATAVAAAVSSTAPTAGTATAAATTTASTAPVRPSLPEEAQPSAYSMRGVAMSDQGFLMGTGKLPEANAPMPPTPTTPIVSPHFPVSLHKPQHHQHNNNQQHNQKNEPYTDDLDDSPVTAELAPQTPSLYKTKAQLKQPPVTPRAKTKPKHRSPGRPPKRSPIRGSLPQKMSAKKMLEKEEEGKNLLPDMLYASGVAKHKAQGKKNNKVREESEVMRQQRMHSYEQTINSVAEDTSGNYTHIASKPLTLQEQQILMNQEVDIEKHRVAEQRKQERQAAEHVAALEAARQATAAREAEAREAAAQKAAQEAAAQQAAAERWEKEQREAKEVEIRNGGGDASPAFSSASVNILSSPEYPQQRSSPSKTPSVLSPESHPLDLSASHSRQRSPSPMDIPMPVDDLSSPVKPPHSPQPAAQPVHIPDITISLNNKHAHDTEKLHKKDKKDKSKKKKKDKDKEKHKEKHKDKKHNKLVVPDIAPVPVPLATPAPPPAPPAPAAVEAAPEFPEKAADSPAVPTIRISLGKNTKSEIITVFNSSILLLFRIQLFCSTLEHAFILFVLFYSLQKGLLLLLRQKNTRKRKRRKRTRIRTRIVTRTKRERKKRRKRRRTRRNEKKRR